MGLMPAHRGGPSSAYALKEIVIVSGQPHARPRCAPGRGAPLRRRDGRAARADERVARSRRSAPPPSRRWRRGRSRERTRGSSRSSARACRHGTSRGDARGPGRRRRSATWSRARWRRRRGGRARAPTSSARARRSREPVLRRDWLEPGAHVNAVGASVPPRRELDAETVAAAIALRRPARVGAERGGRPARWPGLGERAHRGRDRRGADRRAPGRTAPTS